MSTLGRFIRIAPLAAAACGLGACFESTTRTTVDPLRHPWDWAGIVGTGQSLAVGAEGYPITGTQQPYGNLKLSLGNATVPPLDPALPALSMVPLVEPVRPFASGYPSAYPRNLYGETPHTAMANQISALVQESWGQEYITAHTVVGESGQPMTMLKKGATDSGITGRAYAATLFEVTAIARLAGEAGKSYGVGAIVITHGESDTGSSTYGTELVKLWSDYNLDLAALTGQSEGIPMLVSQQHSVPEAMGSRSAATIAQWRVGLDHPGDIICSGPKYQYDYAADGVHLRSPGYERLGEKYGQVYFERVVAGRDWQPLQPLSADVAGSVITVRFHVPVPPLAWDETLPPPHQPGVAQFAAGRGFEVRAAGSPVRITGVEIAGADTVRITCDRDLTGYVVDLAYADTSSGTVRPGGARRWGQLRDSDPFVGATTGAPQPNYCVAFRMSIP